MEIIAPNMGCKRVSHDCCRALPSSVRAPGTDLAATSRPMEMKVRWSLVMIALLYEAHSEVNVFEFGAAEKGLNIAGLRSWIASKPKFGAVDSLS